jgi:hypothetical protein
VGKGEKAENIVDEVEKGETGFPRLSCLSFGVF